MFDDDEPEGIIIPVLRFGRHPQQGYIREPSTCKRFYVERGKYCAAKLADAWLDQRIAVVQVKLADLDEFDLPFNAIVPRGAGKQFQETCAILNHNMKVAYKRVSKLAHMNTLQEIAWGYDIPPIGVCDVLGYRSSTAAWLVTHPQGPALLTKANDPNAEDDIAKFLLHWAQADDIPDHWFDKHEGPELLVDGSILPRLSTLSTRPRKPMPKEVRRFIIR